MTTKHHDGFAMYNTSARGAPGQDVYGVMGPDCPTQRDLYGEVASAMRERGIRVGACVGITNHLPSVTSRDVAPCTWLSHLVSKSLGEPSYRVRTRKASSVFGPFTRCVEITPWDRYFSKADWHANSFWDPEFGFPTDRNTNYDIATNASR